MDVECLNLDNCLYIRKLENRRLNLWNDRFSINRLVFIMLRRWSLKMGRSLNLSNRKYIHFIWATYSHYYLEIGTTFPQT